VRTVTKRVITCLVAVIAGAAAWPVMEVVLHFQPFFGTTLRFLVVQGAALGVILGSFFGGVEGLITYERARLGRGAAVGAAFGLIGGVAGALAGQALLFFVAGRLVENQAGFTGIALPAARAAGWACLGVFVGSAEGLRALSPRKLGAGVLGGFLGGALGGAALEFVRISFTAVPYARLAGLVLLALLVGLFTSLVEKRLSAGVLKLLNGELKGKEFDLSQRRMRIGASGGCEIRLGGYDGVAERHAVVRIGGGNVVIEPVGADARVEVNEETVGRRELKLGDVIRVGSARIFFRSG